MFVKGEHERQFAYEVYTAHDRRGFILGVEVPPGNIHDSVAWDAVYDDVTSKFDVQYVTIDAGYKPPWIAKKRLDDGKGSYSMRKETIERYSQTQRRNTLCVIHHTEAWPELQDGSGLNMLR